MNISAMYLFFSSFWHLWVYSSAFKKEVTINRHIYLIYIDIIQTKHKKLQKKMKNKSVKRITEEILVLPMENAKQAVFLLLSIMK